MLYFIRVQKIIGRRPVRCPLHKTIKYPECSGCPDDENRKKHGQCSIHHRPNGCRHMDTFTMAKRESTGYCALF